MNAEVTVAERVEGTRFLGPEFIVWLWFKIELFEAQWARPGGGTLQIVLDSQLSFASIVDQQERTTLKGINPSATKEAKMAVLCGKMPVSAKVSLTLDETQDFSFVLDGRGFSFSSVKLPQTVTDKEEQFFDRMQLLDALHVVFGELYEEFVTLRTSTLWEREFVPCARRWTQGESSLSAQTYTNLLKRARKR